MSHTRPATNSSLVDCHFFITSRCDKRDGCDFRHNKECLRTTIVCPKYVVGECKDPDVCSLRHPLVCKHDRKPGGCNSTSCPYHHLNPCTVDGTRLAEETSVRSRPAVGSTGRQSRVRRSSRTRTESLLTSREMHDNSVQDMVVRMQKLCCQHGMPAGSTAPGVVLDAIEEVARNLWPGYQEFLEAGTRGHRERQLWFESRWNYIERSVQHAISDANQRRMKGRSLSVASNGIQGNWRNQQHRVQPPASIALVPDQAVRIAHQRSRSQVNKNTATGQQQSLPSAQPAAKKAGKNGAAAAVASKAGGPTDLVKTTDLLTGALKHLLNISGKESTPEPLSDSEEFESFEHDDSYFK